MGRDDQTGGMQLLGAAPSRDELANGWWPEATIARARDLRDRPSPATVLLPETVFEWTEVMPGITSEGNRCFPGWFFLCSSGPHPL